MCQSSIGQTRSWGYASDAGICTDSGCCGAGGPCQGICAYGDGHGGCDGKYQPYSRLCYCDPAPGWTLGQQGESCTETCHSSGRVCNSAITQTACSSDGVLRAAAAAGHTCQVGLSANKARAARKLATALAGSATAVASF